MNDKQVEPCISQTHWKRRGGRDWCQSACLLCGKPWVQTEHRIGEGMVVQPCNLSSQGVDAGGSEVLGHPLLCCKSEAILGYERPCEEGIEVSLYNGLRGQLLFFSCYRVLPLWVCTLLQARNQSRSFIYFIFRVEPMTDQADGGNLHGVREPHSEDFSVDHAIM